MSRLLILNIKEINIIILSNKLLHCIQHNAIDV